MKFLYSLLLLMSVLFTSVAEARQYIPTAAYKYHSYFVRYSRFEFGMDAPTAMLAAQVHQESAWNLRAKSAYASGLTQFTPDTEKWIISAFPDLGTEGAVDPYWSIRAMMKYDKRLLGQITARTECDDWAFALSAYNGGLGWVLRDKKLAKANGKDPFLWWNNVELYSSRAPHFIKENRDYPVKILKRHQNYYLASGKWGTKKVCE